MSHCGRFLRKPLTRREVLLRCAGGFGSVALAALLDQQQVRSSEGNAGRRQHPFATRPPHFQPTAKNVIFLYMDGGPSQVDTFDPKPLLDRENGKPFGMKMEPTQFDNNGNTLASPW